MRGAASRRSRVANPGMPRSVGEKNQRRTLTKFIPSGRYPERYPEFLTSDMLSFISWRLEGVRGHVVQRRPRFRRTRHATTTTVGEGFRWRVTHLAHFYWIERGDVHTRSFLERCGTEYRAWWCVPRRDVLIASSYHFRAIYADTFFTQQVSSRVMFYLYFTSTHSLLHNIIYIIIL